MIRNSRQLHKLRQMKLLWLDDTSTWGLWLTENNSPLLDLKSRFAIAQARLGQFRVAIFGNKALPLRKKVLLF